VNSTQLPELRLKCEKMHDFDAPTKNASGAINGLIDRLITDAKHLKYYSLD